MAYASLTANKDPRTGLYKHTPYKSNITPFKPIVFEKKKYKDPVTIRPTEYQPKEYKPSNFKPTVKFDPYLTLLPYQLPNIDPLTGRPYPPRKSLRDSRKVAPEPKPEEPVHVTQEFGNAAASMRRMLKFVEPR